MKKEINTLLFCGGGVRSVSFIGILKRIEELINIKQNETEIGIEIPIINIKTVAGVSAGAMFALIYLIGSSAKEMEDEILHKKLDQLKDIRFMNFLSKYGLDSGNNLMMWLESLMVKKGFDKNITFKQFYEKTNIDFQVFAANLNKYKLTKFNHIESSNLKIIDGIRMSISIPFMFTINKYDKTKDILDDKTGEIFVDAGLISNYPIYLFKDSLDTLLGFKLTSNGETDSEVDEKINDIESYIYHILACFMVQRDKNITMNKDYQKHTIYIDTENLTQTVNFGLSAVDKKRLIDIGYKTATKFFEN
jgi:predicted acylesterase/phospholipase RssA